MNERVKAVRKHENVNLSQEAFGNRIGLTKAAISKIEKGVSKMSEQTILSICREFNVNEEWLRTGSGDMFSPMSEDEELDNYIGPISGGEDTFKKNLLKALCKLTDEEWNVLKKIIAEMKEG